MLLFQLSNRQAGLYVRNSPDFIELFEKGFFIFVIQVWPSVSVEGNGATGSTAAQEFRNASEGAG